MNEYLGIPEDKLVMESDLEKEILCIYGFLQ
jgi:hypothetical protein